MRYPVLVVDDLRSFEGPNTPYEDDVPITYIRDLTDLQIFIMDYKHVHVRDLWMDYDLGGTLTGEHIINEFINLQMLDEGSFTVDNIYIVTQNPIGRDRLLGSAKMLSDHVIVLEPVANGLISAPIPEEEVKMGTEYTEPTEAEIAAASEEPSESEATSEETTSEG